MTNHSARDNQSLTLTLTPEEVEHIRQRRASAPKSPVKVGRPADDFHAMRNGIIRALPGLNFSSHPTHPPRSAIGRSACGRVGFEVVDQPDVPGTVAIRLTVGGKEVDRAVKDWNEQAILAWLDSAAMKGLREMCEQAKNLSELSTVLSEIKEGCDRSQTLRVVMSAFNR